MVVLLHGFGEDSSIWQHQVDELKNHYRLIVPDLPGSGASALLDNGNIEIYAAIVQQIIVAEQQKNHEEPTENFCTVIGHSMGGYITLALAEKYADLLNGFALVHSTAFADSEEKIGARKKAINFIQSNGTEAFLQTSIPGLFYQPEMSAWPSKLMEQGKNFTKAALIQYYQAMLERPDRTAVLQQSVVPVLFIIGQHDAAIPFESSLKQCHLPAQSHVHILRHSAHMGMLEEKEKCNAILLDYLHQCNKPAG